MSERAVKAFDTICLPGFFTHSTMAFGGKNRFIGRPEIGIADCALSINGWQRLPERWSAFPASITDMDPDNLAGIPVDG